MIVEAKTYIIAVDALVDVGRYWRPTCREIRPHIETRARATTSAVQDFQEAFAQSYHLPIDIDIRARGLNIQPDSEHTSGS